jgi:hypothetical protein
MEKETERDRLPDSLGVLVAHLLFFGYLLRESIVQPCFR